MKLKGRNILGLADLVTLLEDQPEEEHERLAAALGYRSDSDAPARLGGGESKSGKGVDATPPSPAEDVIFEKSPLTEIPFLFAARWQAREVHKDLKPERLPGRKVEPWSARGGAAKPGWPLRSDASLVTYLREELKIGVPTRKVDVERSVEIATRGLPLDPVPRRVSEVWPTTLHVIGDRRSVLAPFWDDQDELVDRLETMMPQTRIEFRSIHAIMRRPEDLLEEVAWDRAEVCLALTDFGAVDGDRSAVPVWRAIAERLPAGRALALVFCNPSDVPADLRQLWKTTAIEENARETLPEERRARAESLLELLAPAMHLNPRLLRAVRQVLVPEADLACEAIAWSHSWLRSPGSASAVFEQALAEKLRSEFEQALAKELESELEGASGHNATHVRALRLLRAWRAAMAAEGYGDDLWFSELLSLGPNGRKAVPATAEIDEARRYFLALGGEARSNADSALATRAWLSRIGREATRYAMEEPAFSDTVWEVKHGDGEVRGMPVDRAWANGPARTLAVSLLSGRVHVETGRSTAGSPLAALPSINGLIGIDPEGIFSDPSKPDVAWADRTDYDDFGLWAEVDLAGATMRFRWCPPGSFLMGSPEDEARWQFDERPQTEINFKDGFWIMETPVAQATWLTIMKDNPSRMLGGSRPVETVTWEYACTFLDRANAARPNLALRLPSEAEWEYACRAGTTSRYAWGEAWDDTRANGNGKVGSTTGIGATYPANPWGLYDMHGNVWEWCADVGHNSHEGAASDGSARQASGQDGGTLRVIRGGSWYDFAERCRAASRTERPPGLRDHNLGFRPARGQARSSGRQESAERSALRAAEAGEAEPAVWDSVEVIAGRPKSLPKPAAPFVIRTDRGDLVIQRLTRSDLGGWASGMGRDRFGLWADFTVGDIRQRLRWCPPGPFLMGSPEDEAGRYPFEAQQTEISFERGFWMFDTPVTQELYMAVTGKTNPSRFVSPTRPVETVSWSTAQAFIDRINERLKSSSDDGGDGLLFKLPSEAEWEYACRAGTNEATYAGPLDILGENNAPILDEIAWYGGNSGKDFELEKGHDSSGWPNKQYDHGKAGSMPVRLKRANPWGLYDMLGNVWEWCADVWNYSHQGAASDGSPRQVSGQDGGTPRVIRGGSWDDSARGCRAADRGRYAPDARDVNLGFRPARG